MFGFSDATIYQINLFWGILNIIFSVIGIYFVYRWGVTLLSTDDTVRRILMGEPFFTWFAQNDNFLFIATSLYLGFKIILILSNTARWEVSMEKTREKLAKAKKK